MKSEIFTIYKLENLVTGHAYIGLTRGSLADRLYRHAHRHGRLTSESITQFGKESFRITALYEAVNSKEGHTVERALIGAHNTIFPNGYNLVRKAPKKYKPVHRLTDWTRAKLLPRAEAQAA